MGELISETWTARKTTDESRHLAACVICRENLRPREDQKLYAVKNARTRQFIHALVNGKSLEETIGWPKNEILYSLLLEDGASKGPPMSEEVKVKLREVAEKRREEKKLKCFVRANTPARLVEGEQEEKMARKKKSKGGKSADSFLPAKFVRSLHKKDHTFERDGDGWRMDGAGPVPLRQAMAKLIGEKSARATSFVRFFRADRIVAAGKEAKKRSPKRPSRNPSLSGLTSHRTSPPK